MEVKGITTRPPDAGSGEDLIEAVRDFFYSEGLTEKMEAWAITHSQRIDLSLAKGEGHHHYGAMHRAWVSMYESSLVGFLARRGATPEQFYEALVAKRERRSEEDVLLIEMIDATADYQFWLEMMIETAEETRERGQREDAPETDGKADCAGTKGAYEAYAHK